MKKILVVLPVLTILLAVNVMGQVSQNAVPFLLIAPGARAGGMGETFVAIADDATATHWNPAGLGRYPLSSNWLELSAGKLQKIQTIALVENDKPDINYKKFDIWAIIDGHLGKYDNGMWNTTTTHRLDEGRSIKSVILSFTGLDEEQIEPFYNRLVRLNNDFPLEKIDSLQQKILVHISDDYQYKDEINYGFDRLKTAWQEIKINSREFSGFEAMIENSLADNQMLNSELDSIAFGFDRVFKERSIEKIDLPLDMILDSPVNCLESHGGMLYVGTDDGFYRFDPKRNRWKSYGKDEDLLSTKITALAKYRRKSIIIGTDRELIYFDGARIKKYAEEKKSPLGHVTAVAAASERKVWAALKDDLYLYDGTEWRNYFIHEVSIGETLDGIVESFYSAAAVLDKKNISEQVNSFNEIEGELTVGQKIKLPFKPVLKGKMKTLAAKDDILWIGTSLGVVMFNGESFYHFGYKEYVPEYETTVEDIARQFLPDPTPEKISQLSKMIKHYNNLKGDLVGAGQTVFVYANALGSPTQTLAAPSAKRAYVGTSYGVIEYNDGVWTRFPKPELARTSAHTIKAESGEMWFATEDNVYILSKAYRQITYMHSNYLKELDPDIYYEFFSIVYPTSEWGTFGLGITYLSMGSMQRTSETGQELGFFHPYDIAITMSYGTSLLSNLSAGLSARYINSHLSEAGAGVEKGSGTGYSFAMDGGVLYQITNRTTLAATVTNIGPDMSYIDADQADPLPRKLAVAFAHKIIDSPFNRLTFLGEASKLLIDLDDDLRTEIDEIIPHIGIEYWYSSMFSGRGGYVYDKIGVQRYFTLGFSLQYLKYRFDFSYVPQSNIDYNRMGNTMRFSMNVRF